MHVAKNSAAVHWFWSTAHLRGQQFIMDAFQLYAQYAHLSNEILMQRLYQATCAKQAAKQSKRHSKSCKKSRIEQSMR